MDDGAAGRTGGDRTDLEPIAVIGMSGRFPDADDIDAFWDNLASGTSSIRPVPVDRGFAIRDYYHATPQTPGKTYSIHGGFLQEIDRFDPLFFEIPPNHAERIDPSARLFLEEAWRALEDAGYAPRDLDGANCGMFFCAKGDYPAIVQRSDPTYLAATDSFGPARLAYHLNLVGPAISIDTACSSTLAAIVQACDALSLGNCDMAIVGGGGLNATPNALVTSSQFLLFSPSGKCRAFDAEADGTVLGEAIAAVVLKPLSRALADGDQIHGLLRGWGLNQDGRTNGFTAPSARAQVRLQSEVYRRFGIDPRDITLLEAHGTGTRLGDTIELQALTESFRQFTADTGFCAIGSLKANIGHAFFGAGIASLVKVLLCLRERQIPPLLNFRSAHPSAPFEGGPFFPPAALTTWKGREGRPLTAAINAFGATGINAHVVVQEHGAGARRSTAVTTEPGSEYLFVLSGKSDEALRAAANRLAAHLQRGDASAASDLASVAYTLQIGRDAMPRRLAVVAASREDLLQALREAAQGQAESGHRWRRGAQPEGVVARLELASALVEQVDAALASGDLEALRDLWSLGAEVEWRRLYGLGRTPQRVSLPTYPFDGERYWLAPTAAPAGPLQLADISKGRAETFETQFTGDEFFLDDHRILGERVLPAVAYLEMALRGATAWAKANGVNRGLLPQLRNVVWMRRFVFGDCRQRLTLRIRGPIGSDHPSFTIFGQTPDGTETQHCQGDIEFATAVPGRLDPAAIEERCPGTLSAAEVYSTLHDKGFGLGPAHQGLVALRFGEDCALSRLRLPSRAEGAFYLNPAMLDSGLQTAFGLMVGRDGPDRGPALPFALDRLDVLGPTEPEMWAHVQYAPDSDRTDRVARTVITLADVTGRVCLRLFGLTSRPPPAHAPALEPASAIEAVLLTPVWRAQARADRRRSIRRSVLVCGDDLFLATLEAVDPDIRTERLCIDPGRQLAGTYLDAAQALSQMASERLAALATHSDDDLIQLVLAPTAHELRGLSGLLRSAAQENSRLHWQVLLLDRERPALATAAQDALGDHDQEIRYGPNGRETLTYRALPAATTPTAKPWRDDGVYLIAGGAGGLGRLLATEIASVAAGATVVLTGRAEPAAREAELAALQGLGVNAVYRQADICDQAATTAVVNEFAGALRGVFHCAATLDDGYLLKRDPARTRAVLAPKVEGVEALDRATAGCPLDFFVVFGSLAGPLGNAGQSDYAAANGFLDTWIAGRTERVRQGLRRGRSLTLDWPLWRDGGMRIDRAYEELTETTTGLSAIETSTALAAFYAALAAEAPQVAVFHGRKARLDAVLGRFAGLEEAVATTEVTDESGLREELRQMLASTVSAINHLPAERVSHEVELSKLGLDSISLTQLANQLNRRLGLRLSPTVFFEHVTLAAFADHLLKTEAARLQAVLRPRNPPPIEVTAHPAPIVARAPDELHNGPEPIAIIGLSARFPMADDVEAFWQNLRDEKDCITEIPSDRWDWRAIHGDPLERAGVTDIRWGGFINGVPDFDSEFFGVSRREAELMDPQHRLLLLHAWKAIEDAGYSPRGLAGTDTAVFVGTADSGYADLFRATGQKSDGSGTPICLAPNRVSFFLDLHGPSEPVETACSSSLVAIQRGVEAIRSGRSRLALVGGVQTIPTPTKHISFSQAGILCQDGRCKTFSDAANGYVRAEGVGILLLKSLSRAQADGDAIHGVILAAEVNHGGRANSLTSPNPRAQADLIKAALRQANVDPRTIGYIEAHGTGTELGDPIEINGLKAAFAELQDEEGPADTLSGPYCGIGSVKSNIGHTELAAGAAGVIKVLLQMREGKLARSLHCETVNPHIDLDRSPFYLVREARDWPCPRDSRGDAGTRRAGVSSFGVGGVNAHVVLEAPPPQSPGRVRSGPYCIVLSARHRELLPLLCTELRLRLLASPDLPLDSVAYTLQVGREAMRCRLALIVEDRQTLIAQLGACANGDVSNALVTPEASAAAPGSDTAVQADAASRDDLVKLADLWVCGGAVNWSRLYGDDPPRRLHLPTYPFRLERHWLDLPTGAGESTMQQTTPPALIDPAGRSRADEFVDAGAAAIARLQDRLVAALADVLRTDPQAIDLDQVFVEMGLNSVVGVEWIRRVSKEIGVTLKVTSIYDYPTVREFARFLSEQSPKAVACLGNPPAGAPREADRALDEVLRAVGDHLGIPPNAIDPDLTFDDFGLGSGVASGLLARFARQFGRTDGLSEPSGWRSFRDLAEHFARSGPPDSGAPVPSVSPKPKGQKAETGPDGADARVSPTSETSRAIAVIGIAARFPAAPDIDAFWSNIASGADCVSLAPDARWDPEGLTAPPADAYPFMGALADAEMFDPLFFNISPKEARLMDPQQRVFLETCWACLEDAAIDPVCLAGQRCGMFVGCSTGSYGAGSATTHAMMGNASSILAARLSYFLDLHGPCLAIDTACSSSLVAVCEACTALVSGSADLALAGGVNVFPSRAYAASAAEGGMLSPDGRCFTFDQRANGFVPAEGSGVVLLKRLEDALRDGDRVQGVIQGWGVNHDGRTNGMTAPSALSQSELQCDVYRRFCIDPRSIGYVEAHGTGTALGDPIEVEALTNSFAASTHDVHFCALGSVKANIGHTLAAAGVAGLIKALLSLGKGALPPLAHFGTLNPEISIDDGPFYINRELRPWPQDRRRAAVSSFSYCGTNAHLVVDGADSTPRRPESNAPEAILLSARTPEALRARAEDLRRVLTGSTEDGHHCLDDVAHTLQVGREAMSERLAFIAATRGEAVAALDEFLAGGRQGILIGQVARASDRQHAPPDRTDAIAQALARGDLHALLKAWISGERVDWTALPRPRPPRRVPLPTYRFRRTRYWCDAIDRASQTPPPIPVVQRPLSARFEQALSRV